MASSPRIEELEKKFNENPRRYFAPLANEYRKAGDLEQAISICRTYVPQQPAHMSGHIVFGQALFETGEHDEARGVFEAALALDPENLIALRHLGDIAASRGETVAARSWYQRVLDADPRNDEVTALLASLDAADGTNGRAGVSDQAGMSWADLNPERTLELPPELLATGAGAAESNGAATGADASAGGGDTPPAPSAPLIGALDQIPPPPPPAMLGDDWPHLAPAATARESVPAAEPPPRERSATSVMDASAHESGGTLDVVSGTAGVDMMELSPPVPGGATDAGAGAAPPFSGVMPPPLDPTPAAFVTETMAELYLQQGFHDEALNVYRQLAAQHPADTMLRERIDQLERSMRSGLGGSDSVTSGAQPGDRAPSTHSIRAFFGELATRRPAPRTSESELPSAPPPPSDPLAERFASGETAADGDHPMVADRDPLISRDDAIDGVQGGHMPPWVVTGGMEGGGEEVPPETGWSTARDIAPDMASDPAPAGPPRIEPPAIPLAADSREPGGDWGSGSEGEASGDGGSTGTVAERQPMQTGSVDILFSEPPAPESEHAAATLSSAFGGPTHVAAAQPPLAPARPPKPPAELSLDQIFGESATAEPSRREPGAFSFDQFFRDGTTSPGGSPSDGGAESLESASDAEQFSSWLAGLKKK